MAQISFVSGSSFFTQDERASKAGRFAASIKSLKNDQGVEARLDGADVEVDHMSAVASTGLAAEVQALSSAASNTTEGISLLQTVEDGLSSIETRLAQLDALAEQAETASLSDLERAQLDTEFQSLLAEIDDIVATTQFNGTSVLAGNGSGGALQINYKVGTGSSAGDEIAVTINAASVSDLSAGLSSASLQTAANATSAQALVVTAQTALGSIQGAVTGSLQAFASSAETSASLARGFEAARAQRVEPAVVIDLSQVVAGRISKEQGIDLSGNSIETMRKILIELNSTLGNSPVAANAEDADVGSAASAASSGNLTASVNSSSPTDDDRNVA